MSLSAVIDALNAELQADGTIDLYAAVSAQPALAPLGPVLHRFTIDASFVVTGARVTPGTTAVTLTGAGRWGPVGVPAANVVAVTVRLDCAVVAGVTIFTLTLGPSAPGWTFGATFPYLPDTLFDVQGSVGPGPSFLTAVRLDTPQFAGRSDEASDAALILTGALPDDPFWTRWSALVGPWPLQLRGECLIPVTPSLPPKLDLLATTANTISLTGADGLTLTGLGFQFISDYGPDPENLTDDAITILNLSGRLRLGTLSGRMTCPVLASGSTWHLIVVFDDDGGGIVEGTGQLGTLLGLPDVPLPTDFLPLPRFRFNAVEFFVQPDALLRSFPLTAIGVTISTPPGAPPAQRSWSSPVPFVTVEEVGMSWSWSSSATSAGGVIAGNVFGTLAFTPTANTFHIDTVVMIPGWSTVADLRYGDYIPVSAAFREYFGSGGPPTPADMNVVELAIGAEPATQFYYARSEIMFGTPDPDPDPPVPPLPQGWEIDLGITQITLEALSFHVEMNGGVLSGGLAGQFLLGPPTEQQAPRVVVGADYPGPAGSHPEGWTFHGQLVANSTIGLPYMVQRYLGQASPPDWVPDVTIDRLYFRCNTSAPIGYAFGGTISARWNPTIFGTTLKISAAASIDMEKPRGATTATGQIAGLFTVNKLKLSAALTLGVAEPVYRFKVQFGELWLQAVTGWRDDSVGTGRHQVVALQLGGTTIGQILEYLVNLAAPTLGYTLDPPWDVLNRIELSRFTLTLDPKESTVELVYAANADLGFGRLDTIGVRYRRAERAGVSLILTGSLLGQRFDGDDLSWDVIDGAPPPMPGTGATFLKVRYLGLGQRVQLTTVPDTVAETLALLEGTLKPPLPGQNPLVGQGVEWSPVSQWLIGVDLTLLDTVDLGVIFNDPWIYGLSIALGGKEAGSLAGLRFEILYKRISDTVGMFRIELTLPEAFRHFEFGEVSVTLGTVVVEIYTNGNFKVDLGFPHNRNFDRSFSVEVFPFLGRGGIYFGLLDGTTSRRVPRITNGTFSPVIELGVGLAVGVGKDVSFGPLSGGIYVQVEVIFEGVLGWFHPSTAGAPTATYYWAQGTAAIHGKLYGSVDFKVIKVSVTLDAYAAAIVTLEAHKPTVFRLEVSVSAEAEVKIWFVRVSFSFEVDLDVSFKVGSESATPWLLAPDQPTSGASDRMLAFGVDPRERQRVRSNSRGSARRTLGGPQHRLARRHAALRAAAIDDDPLVALNWQPTKAVFGDAPRTAHVVLVPAFTLGDVPLAWSATVPANSAPAYRFSMQLFAPSGVSTAALTARDTRVRDADAALHAVAADDLDALAADTLVAGLLLYALYALPNGPQAATDTITAGQLAWLGELLDRPAAVGAGFASGTVAAPGDLAQFFATNVHLSVSGQPAGGSGAADDADPLGGMAMALPPFLGWTSTQTGPVDFNADNPIGPLYLWGVQTAAALFSPSGTPPPGPPTDPLDAYVSFASHVFGDWALLIATSAVREAAAALTDRVLPTASATDTLAGIAGAQPQAAVAWTVRAGDTIDTIAAALGATVDELLFLNPTLTSDLAAAAPGATLSVKLGVSPEMLANDNPGAALVGSGFVLGDLTIPVAAGQTLAALVTQYGTTAATILGVPGQGDDAKLLAAGTTFDAPATTWINAPAGCTALRAAAIFYVRYTGVPLEPEPEAAPAAWYAQALADLNAALLKANPVDPRSQELPAGLSLAIPTAYQNATPVAAGYVTVVGDTLLRIGAALNLEQNEATTTGTTGWPVFRDAVTAVTGRFAIPAQTGVVVLPGETFAMLARRTIVNWGTGGADWSGLAGWLSGAAILAPLALITVPGVTTPTGTGYTFATLAGAYGLSLGEVGRRLATVAGLVAGAALTVKQLPADTVASLTGRLGADAVGRIASESSRYLLSGQRIPTPVPVAGQAGHVEASLTAAAPLYDETRQQWDLPVDADAPTAVALALAVTAQMSWITLFDSATAGAGANAAPPRLNRALAAGRALPPGAIVLTGETDTLSYSFTNAQVIAAAPATGLAWLPHTGPSAIPVRGETPVSYDLAQQSPLQSAIALPVPGFDPLHNTLSLHPFPAALRGRAVAGTTNRYQVYAGQADTVDAAPVPNTTFAMTVAFKVRRIAEAPGVYALIGVDPEQLPPLLALIEYLTDTVHPPTAGTVAFAAVPPPVTAGDPAGLALVDGTAWLIKSNLSTETVPINAALTAGAADDPPPLCYAELSDPAAFALLLWEGTTVGGTGYTFGLTGGLNDGAFDASDEAVVRLLVIAGAQQAAASGGRTLLAFDTDALVVDQGIADGATLFAEAVASSDSAELLVQALLPAGSTGLQFTLDRPVVPATGGDPEDAFRQQFSLATLSAASGTGAPYAIPATGLPALPQASDGSTLSRAARTRQRWHGLAADDPAPQPYWTYQSVLPVYRFGPASVTPSVAGLPPPADDPYRGLGAAAARPNVAFALGFGDLFGNRTAAADAKAVPVSIGYSDPLIGPTAWPGLAASYAVTKAGTTVTLTIALVAKPQMLMPGIAQRGDALRQTAARQQAQYAASYYQYAQPGLTVTAETSLQTGASLPLGGAAGLPAFAGAAYLNAAGATLYDAVIPASATLSAIVADYGIAWEALATVNGGARLADIFGSGTAITVPAFAVMASGDTALRIAANAAATPGWPVPSASEVLTDNQTLPLRIGAVLAFTAVPLVLPATAPTLSGALGLTAETDAALARTAAGWLASDSATDAILASGFVFTVDGVSVTVGTTQRPAGGPVATFADAVASFAALGVNLSAFDLGQAHPWTPQLLTPATTGHRAHYVVTTTANLATNASGIATSDLIAANLGTPDLFDAGALVALGAFGIGSPPTIVPAADDRLGSFAARYACPPAALLFANAARAVIADSALAIPGAVALPPSAALYVPYTLRTTDVLSAIAAGFDVTGGATALAERNAELPGTVAQGLSYDVTVGGVQVPVDTTGLSSFAQVLAVVQATASTATMADVAAAFETPGRLAAGGLLVCPPVKLASVATPSDIPTRYGVSAAAFALANAGVTQLLVVGAEVAAPAAAIPKQTVTALDTLNSVLGRVNAAYQDAGRVEDCTLAALIAANPDLALFAAGARAVLPPADVALTTPVAAAGPYPGASFPLTVELIVARPAALVDPGFVGTSAAATRATIAAPASGASLNFNAFADALTTALPNLRLATAKLPDHAADLWAVDFGAQGITSVALERGVSFDGTTQARMIGLAPLYPELVSRSDVAIAPLVAGSLVPSAAVDQHYQGIDVETWAGRFLTDFDRMLAPGRAAAVNAVAALRPDFVRIMQAKAQLQVAIPGDLTGIFRRNVAGQPADPRAVTDPGYARGLAEARRVFGEALGGSLAATWATAALVQYDAAVDSAWTRTPDPTGTAALYGQARAKAAIATSDGDPPWRLAAGKVALAETAPFLTLPLSVSDPAAQARVSFDLTYAVANLEIHRRPVAAAPGYTRSDWLGFAPVLTGEAVPPALQLDLGATQVPIPLKAYPALPMIVAQTATADPTTPPTLATAALWTFATTYAHEHAAQDRVGLTVELNLSPPASRGLRDTPTRDLFAALAQYVAVADELNGLLAALTDPAGTPPSPTVQAAVATFADLATDIAAVWSTRLPNAVSAVAEADEDWVASRRYPFSAAIAAPGGVLASYTLTRLPGAVGPALGWPVVEAQATDGSWVPLIAQTPVGDACAYVPATGTTLHVPAWRSFRLGWPGLNVAGVQNGRARLDVVRNFDLLDATGPATADAFVYRTATVTATDIATPSVVHTDPIALTGASVEAALQSALDTLFPVATRAPGLRLTYGLFYGYTLAGGADPLVSELPVGLVPDLPLDAATAHLLATALTDWQAAVKPNPAGAVWIVSMTVYSAYDPGRRVVLSLDRLRYALPAPPKPKRVRKR